MNSEEIAAAIIENRRPFLAGMSPADEVNIRTMIVDGIEAHQAHVTPPPPPDKLTLKIEREVAPKEVAGLVFGTGALTYPWWQKVHLIPIRDDIDQAEATDTFVVVVDDPEEAEGSGKFKTKKLTMQQIVDAAAIAIRKGYVYETDAIKEDLGYCDAEQADIVLQLAALGGEEPVYG